MGNKSAPSPPGKKTVGLKSVLPYILVAAILYFVMAIPWLLTQGLTLVPAIVGSAAVFLLMTATTNAALKAKIKADQSEAEKLLAEDGKDQQAFRKEAWIEGLRTESRKVHDRVFRMGAVISIGLALFAVGMKLVFGLTLAQIYYVAWPIIGLIWFTQIVFLPRGLTYTSFVVFCVMRIGIQMYGLGILAMLPQFAMLPVFYLLMMVFMYGSIMLPNLGQIKDHRPGSGSWEVPKGSTKGQFGARGIVDTQMDIFVNYAKGESDQEPTRGMLLAGPPGTGKTLLAMEKATELGLPVIIADASAFMAPFMGFAQLIVLFVRWKVEALAREFGGALFFIDEGEVLFGARSGMQQQSNFSRDVDIFDVMGDAWKDWFDAPKIRAREWREQQMTDQVFMMPGAGGGSGAIFPFLTWMSGTGNVPLTQKIFRGVTNTLLDALFVPVVIFGHVLRLEPAKAVKYNIMFLTASNRPEMFDQALLRPGRFGITAEFTIPDEDEKVDIATHYLKIWHAKGYYLDDLLRPERIREFARAVPNASPAEIEQMIKEAINVRVQHIGQLRRCKKYADEGRLTELLEGDQKFWLRFKKTVYDANGVEIPGWDDKRVDWAALMETNSSVTYGRANPEAVNESTRRKVSWHELAHLIALLIFNGLRRKPTLLTVIPRRGSLGMVAHIPHDSKEMHPQVFFEALIRTSVASWVAERFFFGQNLPGVTQDLRTATNVTCLILGKYGMSVFDCPPDDEEYHAKIGEVLISEPETNMYNPGATALIEGVLRNPSNRRKVAITLGMAAIDAYRLIRANQAIFVKVIPEFLDLDEYSGGRLEDLIKILQAELVPLDKLAEEDRIARPQNAFAVINPFYGVHRAEGADTLEQVEAILDGGAS